VRILHTSDLHLGHRLLERSRIEEQEALLEWLVQIIRQEEVELLIIAGDIFDTGAPPNAALKLYYNFLHQVAETECLATLIIGGNHDSVAALNAPRQLLSHFRVQVTGGAAGTDEELFLMRDRQGEPSALVGCVPFLRERDLRTPRPGESIEERDAGLVAGIREHYRLLSEAAADRGDLPLILCGHLFAGGVSGGGERDLYVGNLGQIDSSVFPAEAQYVALGHLHRAQAVGGSSHIRYSGSPLALDFTDDSVKSVTLLNLEHRAPLEVELFPAPVFRRLVSLSGSLPEILWRLNGEAGAGETFLPWLDITVTDPIPEAQERIEEAAAELDLEILRVRYGRPSNGDDSWEAVDEQLEELSPREVFRRRCESRGVEADDELQRAFDELLLEAQARIDAQPDGTETE
jgi:DNA repair protein SbcD/Mre11